LERWKNELEGNEKIEKIAISSLILGYKFTLGGGGGILYLQMSEIKIFLYSFFLIYSYSTSITIISITSFAYLITFVTLV
jgi:hypothetical protein